METDKRSTLALRLLFLATLLGALGDLLLQNRPWGVGAPIFAAAVVGACFMARKFGALPIAKSSMWLGLAAIPIAALFAWRDADGLHVLNGFVLILIVGLFSVRAAAGAVYATSLTDLLARGPIQWVAFFIEGPSMVCDVKWAGLAKRSRVGRYASVGRGLLLAVVPVGLFVVLLANADAVFEKVVTPNLAVDPDSLVQNILVWTLVATLSAGLLRKLFLPGSKPPQSQAAPTFVNEPKKLGITEIATVLISLNAVVGLFVLIQFRYLFGGANLVHATTGLSYSEYARHGFFELLTVVTLSIPILMTMNSLLKRESMRDQRVFRCTAGFFIVQIFIVGASALERMRLYVDFYSLSPLRLYAVAGMAFLLGVLGLFLGTTLRGRSDRFAFGSLVWLATVVVGLNVLNPDAMIAQYNLQDRPGQSVDVELLASLSSDASPVLIDGMSRLQKDKRKVLEQALADEFSKQRDWTSQTLSYTSGAEKWEALKR